MTTPAPNPPVFVYGALRSGTTLLRLMLLSHPGIQSPGEADFLFDHVARMPGGAWRYDREALQRDRIYWAKALDLPSGDGEELAQGLIAQMAAKDDGLLALSIHRNAPVMRALFPDAKIIHLLRDPRDVARSSIGMGWAGNSYYGVDHWVGTERDWDTAAYPEADVLTVHYETLMADLEGELTRICAFLGLPFEPAMLKYYENSTYGPPDPGIAQKWKTKASAREVALIEG
ncbi:MAG: sulfotransferase, partial [Pseudomonadota bacterium]